MTYASDQYYGGCLPIEVPLTSLSVTYTQNFPFSRVVVFNRGQLSGAGQTYTYRFEWPVTDLNRRGDVRFVFINDTDFSTINLQLANLSGTTSSSMAPKTIRHASIRSDGSWILESSTIKSVSDPTTTPSQFIVYGQSVSPFNGTYMYNSVANTWTTKTNRPASSSMCTGSDVSNTSTDNGMAAPHNTYHGDNTSLWQYSSSDSYSSRTANSQSMSNRFQIGIVNGGVRSLFQNGPASGGAMTMFRYDVSGNSWSTSTQPTGFNQGTAQATELVNENADRFMVFGIGTSPLGVRVATVGPTQLVTWFAGMMPPTGSDFVACGLASTGDESHDVHVFGGGQLANDFTQIGVRHHRIFKNDAGLGYWRTGQMLNYGPMGQACLTHGTKTSKFYLFAGYDNAAGAYQTHTLYDETTESFTTVGARSWSTGGGAARHVARSRINWMS